MRISDWSSDVCSSDLWETAVRLLAPMMPHVAEALWAHLGHTGILADTPWPEADRSVAEDHTVTIAVQSNGKLRATLEVAKDTSRDDLVVLDLDHPNAQRQLAGKAARTVIVGPTQIVHLVGRPDRKGGMSGQSGSDRVV